MSLAILFYFLCVQHVSEINNASNYQSTNETYYTQENTMITKHKRP